MNVGLLYALTGFRVPYNLPAESYLAGRHENVSAVSERVCWTSHLVRHAIEHLLAAQLVTEKPPDPLCQVPRGKKVVPVLVHREPPLDLNGRGVGRGGVKSSTHGTFPRSPFQAGVKYVGFLLSCSTISFQNACACLFRWPQNKRFRLKHM